MSTIPLRVDTSLVNQARESALVMERTPTAQIEFWAKIGRAVEAVLSHESVVAVKRLARVDIIDDVLALTRTPEGRDRALAEIARHKGPIYGTDPQEPGGIIETQPDGTQRRGKFMNRRFVESGHAGAIR